VGAKFARYWGAQEAKGKIERRWTHDIS